MPLISFISDIRFWYCHSKYLNFSTFMKALLATNIFPCDFSEFKICIFLFCVMPQSSLVDGYHHVCRICCLHLKTTSSRLVLMLEAVVCLTNVRTQYPDYSIIQQENKVKNLVLIIPWGYRGNRIIAPLFLIVAIDQCQILFRRPGLA